MLVDLLLPLHSTLPVNYTFQTVNLTSKKVKAHPCLYSISDFLQNSKCIYKEQQEWQPNQDSSHLNTENVRRKYEANKLRKYIDSRNCRQENLVHGRTIPFKCPALSAKHSNPRQEQEQNAKK